jgi:hypothetical protein
LLSEAPGAGEGLHGSFVTYTKANKTRALGLGIARSAAILGYGNLVIDPRKSALALLHEASAKGARVFARVSIEGVRPERVGVAATAKNGRPQKRSAGTTAGGRLRRSVFV